MTSPTRIRPLSAAGWPGNSFLTRTMLVPSGSSGTFSSRLKLNPRPEVFFSKRTSNTLSTGGRRTHTHTHEVRTSAFVWKRSVGVRHSEINSINRNTHIHTVYLAWWSCTLAGVFSRHSEVEVWCLGLLKCPEGWEERELCLLGAVLSPTTDGPPEEKKKKRKKRRESERVSKYREYGMA